MLKHSLIIFAIAAFSGCSWCEKIVEVPKEVKIPVKCLVPKVECDVSGKNDVEVIIEMLGCISSYKEAARTCQK